MANQTTPKPKALPINDAAAYLGMKPQYVRTLIRNGKFKPNKVKISPDSEVWRWEIPVSQLDTYRATAGTRTRRADGRSKFVMYATPDELKAVNKLVADAGLGVLIERAYQPKPKEQTPES